MQRLQRHYRMITGLYFVIFIFLVCCLTALLMVIFGVVCISNEKYIDNLCAGTRESGITMIVLGVFWMTAMIILGFCIRRCRRDYMELTSSVESFALS